MTLTRNERAAVLALLLRKDYDGFARLVENTVHLTRDEKVELLSLTLQLAYNPDVDTIEKILKIVSAD